jgi:shikimate kinase
MNITLIGMPGSGKSFVGKLLAKDLQYKFIETDSILEKVHDSSLQSILEKLGDTEFLLEEEKILISSVSNQDQLVVSPGGSIVYMEGAMQFLKDRTEIIYIRVPLSILKERIGETPRGIVGLAVTTLEELYNERIPFYEKWASAIVDGTQKPEEVVKSILKSLDPSTPH